MAQMHNPTLETEMDKALGLQGSAVQADTDQQRTTPTARGEGVASGRVQRAAHGRRARSSRRPQREIRQADLSTGQITRELPFQRLVEEILNNMGKPDIRIQRSAVKALQDAFKAYMSGLFADANGIATHDNRVTVVPQDLKQARRLRGEDV
eukprot:Opistho-1_new@21186